LSDTLIKIPGTVKVYDDSLIFWPLIMTLIVRIMVLDLVPHRLE